MFIVKLPLATFTPLFFANFSQYELYVLEKNFTKNNSISNYINFWGTAAE